MVSRYREERAHGLCAIDAVARTVGTAGFAVAFAGLTVVIALAGMSMLTKMGLAAVAAVVVAVAVALTLVPAVLGFMPDRVLAPSARREAANGRSVTAIGTEQGRGGTRWARFVLRRPVLVLAWGRAARREPATGHARRRVHVHSTTQRRADDALAEAFGPGFNGPLMLVVDTSGAPAPEKAVEVMRTRMADTAGWCRSPRRCSTTPRKTAILEVVPATGPTDAKTKDLVRDLRAAGPAIVGDSCVLLVPSARQLARADRARPVSGEIGRPHGSILGHSDRVWWRQ
ncbi:putative membrane protein YdfJ with MMPL/SSD domain [Actinoplanes campanulatus]|uniref:Putative membrane protein YdfJ with MMPL/SSD domain n=1 Tax=Actinoplanes campanulatus TaxID=113559 RepID=A0A7W5ALJ3_9ACTN|nr:MMPL family transporter [Actinoplanes campanulatus]MBB3098493.1 putative membrane protein YdfJ with MMPL/SSD domain [Actinoplanes campanulatus]